MKNPFAATKVICAVCVFIIVSCEAQSLPKATPALQENGNSAAFFCQRSQNEEQKGVSKSRQRQAFPSLVTIVCEDGDDDSTTCSLLWLPLKTTALVEPQPPPILQRLENVTDSISEFGVFARRGQFYFLHDNQILRQDFKGGINSRVVFAKDVERCEDMTIDQTTGDVYCVCHYCDDDLISKIILYVRPTEIAGRFRKRDHIIYANSSRSIQAFGLDSDDKVLFWLSTKEMKVTGKGQIGKTKLERMQKDGSGRRTLLRLYGHSWRRPFGLTIDTVGKRLFWADDSSDIWYANYDGSGKGMVSASVDSPLIYYDCQLYWIDSSARVNRYDLTSNSASKREKIACLVNGDSPTTSNIAVLS